MIFQNLYHFPGKWQHVAQVDRVNFLFDNILRAWLYILVTGYGASGEFQSLKSFIPNPSPTDFYVRLNIARYVFSRSKYFERL